MHIYADHLSVLFLNPWKELTEVFYYDIKSGSISSQLESFPRVGFHPQLETEMVLKADDNCEIPETEKPKPSTNLPPCLRKQNSKRKLLKKSSKFF